MPTVPIFTAQGIPTYPRSPNYIPSGGIERAQQEVVGNLARLSKGFTEIAVHIRNQRDAIELENLKDQYDVGFNGIRLGLPAELASTKEQNGQAPDFNSEEYLKELSTRGQDLLGKLQDQTSSPRVKGLLEVHATHGYAKEIINIQGEAQKLEIQQNVANLNRLEETSVIAAAVAPP